MRKRNILAIFFRSIIMLLLLLIMTGFAGTYLNRQLTGESDYLDPEDQGKDGKKVQNELADEIGRDKPDDDKKQTQKDSEFTLYYYGQLKPDEKAVYDKICKGYMESAKKIPLGSVNVFTLSKIRDAVFFDHPEIFWVDNKYSYDTAATGEITLFPEYTYDEKGIKKEQALIAKETDACLKGLPVTGSDYDKIKYIYEYVINTVEYDQRVAKDNDEAAKEKEQNIDSSLVEKVSVCSGYAKGTMYLLNKAGIPAICLANEDHAWNMVICDKEYYNLDTTWGDPVSDAKTEDTISNLNYDYLLCNDDMFTDHVPDTGFSYPKCTSLANNYYQVNGCYFTSYDHDRIKALMEQDIDQKKECTEIKFSSRSVYREACDKILKNQANEGALYLNEKYGSSRGYSYITNDERNLIKLYWAY